jgi:hypothetical protein
MIRFKTQKELAEYAIRTCADYEGRATTIYTAVEQGWVKVSKRDDLLKNPAIMTIFIDKLLEKYEPKNIINMFDWKPTPKPESKFENEIEKNLKNKKKLTDERKKLNRSILRSYRIKDK